MRGQFGNTARKSAVAGRKLIKNNKATLQDQFLTCLHVEEQPRKIELKQIPGSGLTKARGTHTVLVQCSWIKWR